MIKGDTYKARCDYQLDQWVIGDSIHNNIDDECCPDFSCCSPELLQPKEIRETFKGVCKKADQEGFNPANHPWYDTKISMLMQFLSTATPAFTDKKVYIAGEELILNANKN